MRAIDGGRAWIAVGVVGSWLYRIDSCDGCERIGRFLSQRHDLGNPGFVDLLAELVDFIGDGAVNQIGGLGPRRKVWREIVLGGEGLVYLSDPFSLRSLT